MKSYYLFLLGLIASGIIYFAGSPDSKKVRTFVASALAIIAVLGLIVVIMFNEYTDGSQTPSRFAISTTEDGNDNDLGDEDSIKAIPSRETNEDDPLTSEKTITEVSLLDLKPYTCKPPKSDALGYPLCAEYDVVDVFGTYYAESLRGYMSKEDGEHSMTYKLNGAYDKLSFTVTTWDENLGSIYTASIYLYVDGEKKVDMPRIESDDESQYIEIELKGKDQLKIEMYGSGNMGNEGISALMCNPTLYYSSPQD